MKNYVVFEEYKTGSPGAWFYVPNEGNFECGRPSYGFGVIKYGEGSVFTGDVFYDGEKFNKLGFGKQDFSKSSIGAIIPEINECRSLFVGEFDHRRTNWIFGNGVMYFTHPDGTPSHFRKGFYSNLQKIDEYQGEFDYSTLENGYTKDMEFDFDEKIERFTKRIREHGKPEAILIGDSYFEFGDLQEYASEYLFSKNLPSYCLNAGIGGSTYFEWHKHIRWLEGIGDPKIIIINLGFNDIHLGVDIKEIESQRNAFLEIIRKYFPNAKIYMCCVAHAPSYTSKINIEKEYNLALKNSASAMDVTVIDYSREISDCTENCFYQDGIHFNQNGYRIFIKYLKNVLDEL